MTPLLFLHGAIGSAAQFDGLLPYFQSGRRVFALNFPGHGGLPTDEPFSVARFADFVSDFLKKEGLAQVDIFGYSMGGYVALYLAAREPGLVRRIFTLGTKFNWSPEIATREASMLNPEKIQAKVPVFADALAARHAPADWKTVLGRTADLMHDLGNGHGLQGADFARIHCPVAIGLGDQDNMVTLEESLAVAAALPTGHFEKIPDSRHPIEQANAVHLVERLREFFR